MSYEPTDEERAIIREEARQQVAYEKSVVESMVMKTHFIKETLTAAGYCDEHAATMVDTILIASALQQQADSLHDIDEKFEAYLSGLDQGLEQIRDELKAVRGAMR